MNRCAFPTLLSATLFLGLVTLCTGGVVTNTDDSGPGSLRNEIADAAPGDTITFGFTLGGATITLASGQLTVDKDLTIDASALPGGITIDADRRSRVFELAEGNTVEMVGLTITGGVIGIGCGVGGGILNHGDLILSGCIVSGNTAWIDAGGGIASVGGALTLRDTTVSDNKAGCPGGGIHSVGQLALTRCSVSGNTSDSNGGGIAAYASMELYDCSISDNLAGGNGCGISWGAPAPATATLTSCVISGNAVSDDGKDGSGGGIIAFGNISLTGCTVSGNNIDSPLTGGGYGGGISHLGGLIIVRNSTVSGNIASSSGGGIKSGGIILENSTVSGNRAGIGAGIQTFGDIVLENSTVSGNQAGRDGGGLYASNGFVTIENSIIAGNTSTGAGPNIENVDDTSTIITRGANLIGGDPMLAPLGLYAGPTQTAPPMIGSPALDSGIPTANTPATDQRGLPRIVGAGLDIGAYEAGSAAGYGAWAAETLPPGGDNSFGGDADADGTSNGVAYGTGPGGLPAITLAPGGAEVSFGYRPEAELDLIWTLLRSTDLQTFEQILQIEAGAATMSPGVTLSGAPPVYILLDENPPPGAAYYRLGVELAETPAPFMEMVPVGNPGNAPDTTGDPDPAGAVAYEYRIGKYEVTNAQYAAFLNAVAATDTNNLYNEGMGWNARGGIRRSGASPNFTYAVKANMGNKPVNHVSWYDALRFCNWLHNGRPSGLQDGSTTEGGAYTLTEPFSVAAGTDPTHGANGRNAGARYWLPGEDEWYKAAYHEPGASGDGYWIYPTRSDSVPAQATADLFGNIDNDTANIANYASGAVWNGQNGNVTTVGSGGAGSASFYGAFDMGGNMLEWNEQEINTPFPGNRGLRGGSWAIGGDFLRSSLRPNFINPAGEGIDIGFRVAGP